MDNGEDIEMGKVVSLAERFPERFPQVEAAVDKAPEPVVEPTLAEKLDVHDGDFFYSSWGYDQTQVDFYRVLEVTKSGKSVKVQKWTATVASSDIHDRVVPGDGPLTRDVFEGGHWTSDGKEWVPRTQTGTTVAVIETKRLRDVGRPGITVDGHSAWKWDGTPKYQTGFGYGH